MLQVDPVVQGYKDILKVMFAGASQTLADFGLAPRKVPAPLTVEQLAARTAKLRATRKARGTLGPKAKKAIKGTVTPATNQPVAGPPNPPKPAA